MKMLIAVAVLCGCTTATLNTATTAVQDNLPLACSVIQGQDPAVVGSTVGVPASDVEAIQRLCDAVSTISRHANVAGAGGVK